MIRIIIPMILIVAGLVHIFESAYYDKNKKDGTLHAEWSLTWLGYSYVIMILGSIMEFLIFRKNLNIFISITGLLLIIFRIPLKYWAIKTLEEYWSPHIRIKANHELIKEGPFKYVRHPTYLGGILELFGIPLFANSYFTLLTASVFRLFIILTRMKLEEKALIETFRAKYSEYMREVWPLLPFKKAIGFWAK